MRLTRRAALVTGSVAVLASLAAAVSPAGGADPTDPLAAQQQPLKLMHVGQALGKAGKLAQVKVLVADTGLDLDNPEFSQRIYRLGQAVKAPVSLGGGAAGTVPKGNAGWDMIGQTNGCAPGDYAPDADPSDPAGCSSHGTLVAGILGAQWNNGVGGAGVAPNARFIPMRTCWDGDQCYDDITPPAVEWAIKRGAKVVSFSWLSGKNPPMAAVMKRHPGTLFVTIPSGNGGPYNSDSDQPYPCSVDSGNVLCVSTSSPGGGLDCGAYGPKFTDLAVPTQNNITVQNGGGSTPTGCATSFASPTAAGVATILFGMYPNASGAQVKRAIMQGTTASPAWRRKSVSGGIIDALGAVRAMKRMHGGGGGGGGGGSKTCLGKRATKLGSNGNDVLRGTNRADVIVGRGGNDTIRGLGGNDLICGGDGADQIHAGTGRDRAYGDGGNDQLVGEEDGDTLDGGAGADRLNGSAGYDVCRGGAGTDSSVNCQRNEEIP